MIIRSFELFDGIMENIAVAMLRYLGMQHPNDILKPLRNNMCISSELTLTFTRFRTRAGTLGKIV